MRSSSWISFVVVGFAGVAHGEPLPTELVLAKDHEVVGGIAMRLETDMVVDREATLGMATAHGEWRGRRYVIAIELRPACLPSPVLESVRTHGGHDARLDGTHVRGAERNPQFERARLVFATALALPAMHRVAMIYGFAQVDPEEARIEDGWAKVFGRIVGTAVVEAAAAADATPGVCEGETPGHLAWRDANGWCAIDFDAGIGPLKFPDRTRVIGAPLDGERTAWIVWQEGAELVEDAGRDLPAGHSVHAVCRARTDAGLAALRARAAPPLKRP